jgi:hypothetical protein
LLRFPFSFFRFQWWQNWPWIDQISNDTYHFDLSVVLTEATNTNFKTKFVVVVKHFNFSRKSIYSILVLHKAL